MPNLWALTRASSCSQRQTRSISHIFPHGNKRPTGGKSYIVPCVHTTVLHLGAHQCYHPCRLCRLPDPSAWLGRYPRARYGTWWDQGPSSRRLLTAGPCVSPDGTRYVPVSVRRVLDKLPGSVSVSWRGAWLPRLAHYTQTTIYPQIVYRPACFPMPDCQRMMGGSPCHG